ncbi:MAG: hypothetical protein SF052_21055 [Bacteroidia bacterium]|nr:hypothetical protein [Bacteroidia bacterium]
MNFEELKYIWQEHSDAASETMQVSASQIHSMLQARSKSALDKINRNLLIDLSAFILLILSGTGWVLYSHTPLTSFEMVFLGLTIFTSGFFYWRKFRALNRVSITTDNLRASLSAITHTLDFYMKLYFYLVVIAVPVMGSGGMLYGFYKGSQEDGRTLEEVTPAIWMLLVGLMVVYSTLAVLASRWYVQRMFGVHYQELKTCLRELEE